MTYLDVRTLEQRIARTRHDLMPEQGLQSGHQVYAKFARVPMKYASVAATVAGSPLLPAVQGTRYYIDSLHIWGRNTAAQTQTSIYAEATEDGAVTNIGGAYLVPSVANVVNSVFPLNILTDEYTAVAAKRNADSGTAAVGVYYREVVA